MSGKPVYVIDGLRSPILKARGRPGPFTAADMSLSVARSLLRKHSEYADKIDEIIKAHTTGREKSSEIKAVMGDEYSYAEIKVALAHIKSLKPA